MIPAPAFKPFVANVGPVASFTNDSWVVVPASDNVTLDPRLVFVIVNVSVPAFVVTFIPVPETTVNVSLLVSATIVDWLATAMFLNMFCAEPVSVFVTV